MRIEITKLEESTRDTKAGQQTGVKYAGVYIDGEKEGQAVNERFLSDQFDGDICNILRQYGVGARVNIKMEQKGNFWNPVSVTLITDSAGNSALRAPKDVPIASKLQNAAISTDNSAISIQKNAPICEQARYCALAFATRDMVQKPADSFDTKLKNALTAANEFVKFLEDKKEVIKKAVEKVEPEVNEQPEPPPIEDDDMPF